jgi:hypothetical protein
MVRIKSVQEYLMFKVVIQKALFSRHEACKQIIGVWKLSFYRVLTNEQEGIKGIKSETRNQQQHFKRSWSQ